MSIKICTSLLRKGMGGGVEGMPIWTSETIVANVYIFSTRHIDAYDRPVKHNRCAIDPGPFFNYAGER